MSVTEKLLRELKMLQGNRSALPGARDVREKRVLADEWVGQVAELPSYKPRDNTRRNGPAGGQGRRYKAKII